MSVLLQLDEAEMCSHVSVGPFSNPLRSRSVPCLAAVRQTKGGNQPMGRLLEKLEFVNCVGFSEGG